jgi:hypothetical protein
MEDQGSMPEVAANAQENGQVQAETTEPDGDADMNARTESMAVAAALLSSHFEHSLEWMGDPVLKEVELGSTKMCWNGFSRGAMEVAVGDFVYVSGAHPGDAPFIGQVKELFSSPVIENGEQKVAKVGLFTWYNRPEELDLDAPLPVFEKEVFLVDEDQIVSLDMVRGTCDIVSPKEYLERLEKARNKGDVLQNDLFVCSRMYVPADQRIVPLDNGREDEVPQGAREFILNNRVVTRAEGQQVRKRGPKKKKMLPGLAEEEEPKPIKRSRGGRVIKTPRDSFSVREYVSISSSGDSPIKLPPQPKQPVQRGKYGRWAPERFKAAQSALVAVMKNLGANHPHKAILRPKLREEARKAVGDTGLLDYLLKHLADETVSEEGERLRRRHNRTGHMEYWLQDPESAIEENKMVSEEMKALSAELREVREARNLLQTVREEAEHAVKSLKEKAQPLHSVIPEPDETRPDDIQPVGGFGDELATIKAKHEEYAQRASREIEALRLTVDGLSKEHAEMKQRLENQEELLKKLKSVMDRGSLDDVLGDILMTTDC